MCPRQSAWPGGAVRVAWTCEQRSCPPCLQPAARAYPKSGWELSPLPVCSPSVGVGEQVKSYCTALVRDPCLSLEEHLLFSDSLLRWAWLCLPERGKLRHTEMK